MPNDLSDTVGWFPLTGFTHFICHPLFAINPLISYNRAYLCFLFIQIEIWQKKKDMKFFIHLETEYLQRTVSTKMINLLQFMMFWDPLDSISRVYRSFKNIAVKNKSINFFSL